MSCMRPFAPTCDFARGLKRDSCSITAATSAGSTSYFFDFSQISSPNGISSAKNAARTDSLMRFISSKKRPCLFSSRCSASEEWLAADAEQREEKRHGLFFDEMKRINESVRAAFFAEEIPFGELIWEKSKKYDVDPALVAAVIEQESRFKPRAKSHVGAKGLMQLMPRTGRWMGANNLYDPEQNIDAGVKYIAYLNKRFKGDQTKIIAAYNGGEGNVMRYKGIPPFRETRTYVKKVMKNYDKRTAQIEKFEQQQLGGSVPEADGSLALR